MIDSRSAPSERGSSVNSFPGLRRAELGEVRLKGVSKIRYELALDSAPKRLSDKEFEHFMATWAGSGG